MSQSARGGGGVHGRGVGGEGMCGGGVHGKGHAWQGVCMAGGMHGRGTCMQGMSVAGGRAWYTVNERVLRILLECILVPYKFLDTAPDYKKYKY